MKASDEWLVIGGGIGLIVLLFQVYQKAKGSNATQAPSSFLDEAVPTSDEGQNVPQNNTLSFNPPVENISMGGIRLGSENINVGVGSGTLFPLFGYAADNSTEANTYNALQQLLANNANYQQGQDENQLNYLNDNPAFYGSGL